MVIYQLHLQDGTGLTADTEGFDYPDDESAILDARVAVGEVLLSELSVGTHDPRVIVVVSRNGTPMAEVSAGATITRLR